MNRLIGCLSVALLASVVASGAPAQAFPAKPVKLIVGAAPGSSGDVLGRILAEQLAALWKQPAPVENRPGAGGIIAIQALLASPPDGYTLLMAAGSYLTITPWVTASMPYNVETDLAPVAFVAEIPLIMGVRPDLPAHNLVELVDYAKQHPGKINYAANTPGTFPHLATELFASKADIKLTFVPYKGTMAAMQDLMGGRLEMAVEGVAGLSGPILSGSLRPIAVTSAQRLPTLPDVGAVSELIPGFAAVGFYALMVPARTPEAVIRKVNADLRIVLSTPEVAARFVELGNFVKIMSPEQTGAFVKKEHAIWGEVIRRMGFKPK